ncbi:FAD-binding protein [Ruegeria sp.]|uniref:FAD-binding protein n=1 Tax=Ruegeria sp. TaxID=1879320 RepID=UPI003C7B989A
MKPESEAELAEIIPGLSEPVRIVGGGTRGVAGPEAELSTARLRGITLYEPGALTVVARAGTPVVEIETALAAENQQLAFEPADYRAVLGTSGEPTIGGVVAANISGPRRIQAGACRDFLLGVRFVDGRGQVIKNGGRVMKNVTGYDLVKLMAGSWGTLGVLTEVSLKVLPKSETAATLVWEGRDWASTLKLFCDALGAPFEVSGAARLPEEGNQRARTVLRVEGFEDSVKYRVSKLLELFKDSGPDQVVTEPAENARVWGAVRNLKPFQGASGNVWKTSVKPTDMTRVVNGSNPNRIIDWGGGLIWTLAPEGEDLREALDGIPGHSTLVRAARSEMEMMGRFQQEDAGIQALTQAIREKLDPRGLFNPGLMG